MNDAVSLPARRRSLDVPSISQSIGMQPGVFLDRDGTIIEDVGYLSRAEDIRLLPGAADAIRMLNHANVPVVVVTNQSGIGRGFFTEQALQEVELALDRMLSGLDCRISATLHCPHSPLEECPCRKPRPGMLHAASGKFGIDLNSSYMIGDKMSDLEAGRRAGCSTGLVLTGNGRRTYASMTPSTFGRPDYVAANLMGMSVWIIRQLALRRARGYADTAGRR